MDKQISDRQEVKKKLKWLWETYSAHDSDELFMFEVRMTLEKDKVPLLPVLKADKIEFDEWCNNKLLIKCYNKGQSVQERVISIEIVDNVMKLMNQHLPRKSNPSN